EAATTAQPPAADSAAAGPTPDQIAAETARINAWFDAKYEEKLDFSPMARSYQGDKKDYDQFDDFSEAAQDERLEWHRLSVQELEAEFDRSLLGPQAQLSYDLWIDQYERAAAADEFRRNVYVLNHFYAPHTYFAQFLISIHRVDEPSDMEAYIARIPEISRALLQVLETAKLNAAAGSRPPQFSYEGVLKQSRALSSGAPFDGEGDNVVWIDAQAKADALLEAGKIDQEQADQYKAAARQALLEHWAPAYAELIAWVEEDLPNADAIATGVGKNPNGKAYYAERLEDSTTTNLTPEQVHQIGLDGVASVKQEMEAIRQQVGFEGNLQEFFTFVREDDQFYFPNTDEGRQAYIDTATAHVDFIRAQLPEYFGILPKADVVVKRVEAFREKDGAPQHYLLAAPDGSRPGVFYAHLSDMRAMPIPQLEVIAHHEASLGHHLQFSIAQEMTNLPKFRTQLYYNANQEGWGLYSEQLAKEMGAYQDPYSDFGRLTTKLWRYIRLVLDTGLHSKGWTEEQSVEYFLANSPAAEGQVRAEVQRYIVLPGQATGYMIGMLKIQELRKKAEAELGANFDIRGFHDTLLGSGQMPLPMLERQVEEWIAAQQENAL
ncbi:MAG TPA: DUF885 domain-containing protein, partial [Xanthomonadales bacterium]|nr:DUF885 domain-containing protein [Xanthomonadales bacterium]